MKILTIGDTHCGHIFGLTPPSKIGGQENIYTEYPELSQIQWKMWNFFENFIKGKKYDAMIFNGDGIEGKNKRGGGRGLITPNRVKQLKMLAEIFDYVDTPVIYMTTGTPYHVGYDEVWEELMDAMETKAKIYKQSIMPVNANGLLFQCRHKIGRSSTPTGGDIAIRKKRIDSERFHLKHGLPLPDIYIFSHAHYFRHDGEQEWLGVILPSLQGFTEFGAVHGSGIVDFGLVEFNVPDKYLKHMTYTWDILKMKEIYPYRTFTVKERKDK